ncbi:hypothetical protein ACV3J5_19090, partial [Klebsiella pneumoniae]
MLLKKRYGRPLSALSLSLAMAFAPLFNVQAAEPEVVPAEYRREENDKQGVNRLE